MSPELLMGRPYTLAADGAKIDLCGFSTIAAATRFSSDGPRPLTRSPACWGLLLGRSLPRAQCGAWAAFCMSSAPAAAHLRPGLCLTWS